MLKSLSIQNFALIKDVAIEFQNGLSMITGETGAGKSILLGALSLIMGKRADLNVMRDQQSKCIIEANFLLDQARFKPFFDQNDLDFEKEGIIRREILPSGKSRAFINDSPVKLNLLNQLSQYLIDIHSQHQTLDINDEDYQYQLVDAVAKSESLLHQYQINFKKLSELKNKIDKLKHSKQEAQKNLDYNNFLLKELEEIKLENVDLNDLEKRQTQLSNVNLIKEELAKAHQILENEEIGVLEQLNEANRSLLKISDFDEDIQQTAERLNSCIIELQDLDQSFQLKADELEDDPMELEKINQQLQSIYRLQEKHQVAEIDELISIKQQLEEKVFLDSNIDQEIEKLNTESKSVESKCIKLADQLKNKRQKAGYQIKKHVESQLGHLRMKEAQFQIDLIDSQNLKKNGKDEMNWNFSANKGAEMKALSQVASGGELSRISLSLKNLLAQNNDLPTLIFDEIDSGVSGEIANKMGKIMQEMGGNMQLICITHLPQIAAKGKHHYKVYKYTDDSKTFSTIKKLNTDERIKEVTTMLGGNQDSKAAKSHAKTLFDN
jgi:DNA repair protein RecN (Recombination protein N)